MPHIYTKKHKPKQHQKDDNAQRCMIDESKGVFFLVRLDGSKLCKGVTYPSAAAARKRVDSLDFWYFDPALPKMYKEYKKSKKRGSAKSGIRKIFPEIVTVV